MFLVFLQSVSKVAGLRESLGLVGNKLGLSVVEKKQISDIFEKIAGKFVAGMQYLFRAVCG